MRVEPSSGEASLEALTETSIGVEVRIDVEPILGQFSREVDLGTKPRLSHHDDTVLIGPHRERTLINEGIVSGEVGRILEIDNAELIVLSGAHVWDVVQHHTGETEHSVVLSKLLKATTSGVLSFKRLESN